MSKENDIAAMLENLEKHDALTPKQWADLMRWRVDCCYRALAHLAPVVEQSDDPQLKADFEVLRRSLNIGFKWEFASLEGDHKRVRNILKTPIITKADLERAEREHPNRAAQAQSLGISERHLRRLRKELMK